MLAAIESVYPTQRLEWRIDDAGNIHKVEQPGRWLAERVAIDDEIALICNGDKGQYVSLGAYRPPWPRPEWLRFNVNLRLDPDTPALLELTFDLACRFGPAAGAYEGVMYTDAAQGLVRGYMDGARCDELPHGHPRLIGWVNYWSAEACRMLGFTADDARRALFARSAACEGGGVALQVTETPLDLTDPAHRAALEAAWDAFPTIPRKPGRPRAEA